MAEILWEASVPNLKNIVEKLCEEYETNPKYKIKKFYEEEKLVGFCIYFDMSGCRVLEAAYYVGKKSVKAGWEMKKFCFTKKVPMRATIHIQNLPMIKFYQKAGFKLIDKYGDSYVFEKGVGNAQNIEKFI